MATIKKSIGGKPLNDWIAHRRAVLTEVNRKGREVQAKAEGFFSAHNRPGGHEITGGADGLTDYYVYLTGPRAYNVEYGRAGYKTTKYHVINGRLLKPGTTIKPANGIHVLRNTYNSMG